MQCFPPLFLCFEGGGFLRRQPFMCMGNTVLTLGPSSGAPGILLCRCDFLGTRASQKHPVPLWFHWPVLCFCSRWNWFKEQQKLSIEKSCTVDLAPLNISQAQGGVLIRLQLLQGCLMPFSSFNPTSHPPQSCLLWFPLAFLAAPLLGAPCGTAGCCRSSNSGQISRESWRCSISEMIWAWQKWHLYSEALDGAVTLKEDAQVAVERSRTEKSRPPTPCRLYLVVVVY